MQFLRMFQARSALDMYRESFENAPGPMVDGISYKHLDSDSSQIYFVIQGRSETPFEGGNFFGRLVFCIRHGLEQIFFYTPNGRFPINRDIFRDLCSMQIDTVSPGATSRLLREILHSSLETNCACAISDDCKRRFAQCSKSFNLSDDTFRELFPELTSEWEAQGVRPATDNQIMEGQAGFRPEERCPVHDLLTALEHDHSYSGRWDVRERMLTEKAEQARYAAISQQREQRWVIEQHQQWLAARANLQFQRRRVLAMQRMNARPDAA